MVLVAREVDVVQLNYYCYSLARPCCAVAWEKLVPTPGARPLGYGHVCYCYHYY